MQADVSVLLDSKQAIALALQYGKKEWLRSKIMIVGEGRAGKTALANSITGNQFEQTTSTIGGGGALAVL